MCRNFNLFFTILLLLATTNHSFADKKKAKSTPKPIVQTSMVVDSQTGKVLHSKNARTKIYPASLTKVMTLYLAFEAMESRKLSMNKKLFVSRRAASMVPLKLGLKAGETISIRDAILGTIVRSANDASVVLAENIAGSEKNFARLMTSKAKLLGMRNTCFKNASGLHHPEQKTTAMDLAKLTIAIKRDFPNYYPLFSKTSFQFRGNIVNGHNLVTANYAGAEGLKTGYTKAAGCNLITTASRGNKSLIGVVTGERSAGLRNAKMVALLNEHFDTKIQNRKFIANKPTAFKRTKVKMTKKKSTTSKLAARNKQKKRA